MESRWVDLETRLAFQEESIDQLNRSVAEQRQAIEQLRAQLAELALSLRQLAQSAPQVSSEESPPPHY